MFRAYTRSAGAFSYVSVFELDEQYNEKQIALTETFLTSQDNRYNHKVYLLDEHSAHKDIMAMFVLYYSNYHFSHRNQIYIGTYKEKSRSLSSFDDKYDLSWREEHFPDENYWGRFLS